MSYEKARTTFAHCWAFVREKKSDIILVLLVINTVLLLIGLCTHLSQDDVENLLIQQQIEELGGRVNYDRYRAILGSKGYREQQTFTINQKHKIFFPNEKSTTTHTGEVQ